MHSPGVSRRGIEKSCLRTIPRPSYSMRRGMTAVGGALFENRIVEMDCVPTRNALILGGMTQIVRD
jgi:hypothetical protein